MNKEKTLCKPNPFTCIKTGPKSDTYTYSERKGIDSVAFIIRTGEDEYLLTSERKPPMDARINEEISGIYYNSKDEAFIATAFGGSNDKIDVEDYVKMNNLEKFEYFKETVMNEAIEEAGYLIQKSDVYFVGAAFVSSQSNQMCYLYMVDGVDALVEERRPDSEMEAQAKNFYFSKNEIKAFSIDWKANFIVR